MAKHRHKRETNARRPRAALIAAPLAFVATAGAVTLGTASTDVPAGNMFSAMSITDVADTSADQTTASSAQGAEAADTATTQKKQPPVGKRAAVASRSLGSRIPPTKEEKMLEPAAVKAAIKNADQRLWTEEDLNLWEAPGESAKQNGVLDAGEKVLVTGRSLDGREEIVVDGSARWVTAGYLSDEKPAVYGGDCTNGTSVPDGVSENIKKVHAAVCAAFPEITTYGTFRGDGEHSQGIAVDIMVSGDRGWEVAEFIREHYADLGVSYLIYSQQIWSVQRSGEGWRGMEDRGSTTANHYDHVHVTTY